LPAIAGEVFGLTEDPLGTIIGMRIEDLVDNDIDIENWEYSESDDPDIYDLIMSTEGGDQQAVRAIKKKLLKTVGSSPKAAISTLNVLENCVRNCGTDFVTQVCQKDYIENLLEIVMNVEDESNLSVRTKLLALIQSWAFEFSSERSMKGIADVYMNMKDDGIVFPPPSEDDLKEVESEDIEAFFNAHEDENGPVLDEIETLLEDVQVTDSEEKEVENISDKFSNFLVERVVKVEIETLREELQREVENIVDSEVDLMDDDDDDDESQRVTELEHNVSEVDLNDITTEKFQKFLFNRFESVENESK